jgi:hypothetical protein
MKIILGTFKDNADELADFLAPRVGAKADIGGGELDFDDEKLKKTIKSRHVKTYVKRFLFMKGERLNYQILVEGKELRLIELEKGKEDDEKKVDAKRTETRPAEAADKDRKDSAKDQKEEQKELDDKAPTQQQEEEQKERDEEAAKPVKSQKGSSKKTAAAADEEESEDEEQSGSDEQTSS